MWNDTVIGDVVVGSKPSPPNVVSVAPKDDYRILVEFETGEKKLFDVAPYIEGDFYGKLRDKGYFRSVSTYFDGWFVGWPEGQDLDNEEIYEFGVPVV